MKKVLFILIAIVAVSGCSVFRIASASMSGTEYYNNEYRGRTHADIVRNFGAPDRETSDGAGGYILIYERLYSSSYKNISGYMDYDIQKSYIQFFLDTNGICYNVRTNRLSPDKEKSIINTFAIGYGAIAGLGIIGFIAILCGMR